MNSLRPTSVHHNKTVSPAQPAQFNAVSSPRVASNDPTDKPAVRKALLQIVIALEENFHDREDLLQEASLCFWSRTRQFPGQRLHWYLKSVRFYLYHFKTSGRSVDSPKHRGAQASFPDHCDEWDNWRDSLEFDEGFLRAVVARDLFSLLVERLGPDDQCILCALLEGLRITEIAHGLHVPRGFVERHRLGIVKRAVKLGINPVSANPLRRGCP